MAKLQNVFISQLLLGTFRLCLLQRTSSDLTSAHSGENITLKCGITANYEILWYRLSSEEMKLLIIAGKEKLSKSFSLIYNINEGHYDGTINTHSVSLVIIGVDESDLGLYYCGGQNNTKSIEFGKAIRLTVGDGDFQSNSPSAQSDSEPPPDPAPYWIITVVLMSVCFVSVLINLIFSWLFCYQALGKSHSDANADDSIKKDVDLQYVSVQYTAVTRGATQRNTESDLDSVTYSGFI
ncbi:uncharacterized protein LOC108444527 [Pygocentrus nattereri]|uniref:uncharacterized protein LOC108444527 n=1 Tax=Pygocentrus nattereri TaxID=42514 RepID=UPI0008149B8E|nr:uncharacterized protein LOC108444527 [Pygocentrus nattereri]